jgi:hypothetical protein
MTDEDNEDVEASGSQPADTSSWFGSLWGQGDAAAPAEVAEESVQSGGWLGGLFGRAPIAQAPESDDDDDVPAKSESVSSSSSRIRARRGLDSISHSGSEAPGSDSDASVSVTPSSVTLSEVSGLDSEMNLSDGHIDELLKNQDKSSTPSIASPSHRRRKLEGFSPPPPAADLAEPDTPSVAAVETLPAVSEEAPPGFWGSIETWWGGSAAPEPVTDAPEPPPPVTVPTTPSSAARALLPSIPNPPAYTLGGPNTFLLDSVESLSIFGPRRMPRYEGPLRGWPRAAGMRLGRSRAQEYHLPAGEAMHFFRVS